jgi:hypothetical protein
MPRGGWRRAKKIIYENFIQLLKRSMRRATKTILLHPHEKTPFPPYPSSNAYHYGGQKRERGRREKARRGKGKGNRKRKEEKGGERRRQRIGSKRGEKERRVYRNATRIHQPTNVAVTRGPRGICTKRVVIFESQVDRRAVTPTRTLGEGAREGAILARLDRGRSINFTRAITEQNLGMLRSWKKKRRRIE